MPSVQSRLELVACWWRLLPTILVCLLQAEARRARPYHLSGDTWPYNMDVYTLDLHWEKVTSAERAGQCFCTLEKADGSLLSPPEARPGKRVAWDC